MAEKYTTFEDVKVGQVFVEEKGNHSVRYERIDEFSDENGTYNAKLIKPGRPHYYWFYDHELVRIK